MEAFSSAPDPPLQTLDPPAEIMACYAVGGPARHTHGPEGGKGKKIEK